MVGTRFGAAKPSTASPHEARRSRPRHLARLWRLPSGPGTDETSRVILCAGLRAPLTDASARGERLKARPLPSMGRPERSDVTRNAPGVGEIKFIFLKNFVNPKIMGTPIERATPAIAAGATPPAPLPYMCWTSAGTSRAMARP